MSDTPSQATVDKMRRKARMLAQLFDLIDRVPILERIEILEELLDAQYEVLPADQQEGGTHD